MVSDTYVEIQNGRNAVVGSVIDVNWSYKEKELMLKKKKKKVAKDTHELLEMICLNQNIKGEFKNEE